jgi:hypothetical protein
MVTVGTLMYRVGGVKVEDGEESSGVRVRE